MIIILAVLMLAMFWMSSRQRKAQRTALEFVDSLTPGQRVMTASGYVGTVVAIDGDQYTLESVPGGGTTVWVKGAIRKRVDDAATVDVEASPEAQTQAQDEAVQDFVVPDDVSKLIERPSSEGTAK